MKITKELKDKWNNRQLPRLVKEMTYWENKLLFLQKEIKATEKVKKELRKVMDSKS